ncbi:MAG: DNA repair exonuclease [Gemmatimonadota bacterium]|nr:DNA repair exonuclease [Gemmatimonadota bacterium]
MRFLHLADVHLDTSFSGRSEKVRRRLRDASREAFRRAVDLALEEDVDAVLIAGDLFDGDRLSFQTERFLLEQVGRLGDQGISVIYATGNHDPGSAAGGPRTLQWPPNVVTATDATPKRIGVAARAGGTAGYVSTIGHESAGEERDLARMIPAPEGELPEVGLLHTQVRTSAGAEQHGSYAPSELSYLRRAGFDYWALGHIHVPQELSPDPPIWYSGSLQGRSHGEQGAHGALLVDLRDRDAPVVAFRALASVRWETVTVPRLDGIASFDALLSHLGAVWDDARASDPGVPGTEWMVRVVLRGPSPLWAELQSDEDRETLSAELRDLLGVLDATVITDGVHPVIPIDEHRTRTDVLGEALRLAADVRAGRAVLADIGADELAGAPGTAGDAVADYVRELLHGIDGELAARLLDDAGSAS